MAGHLEQGLMGHRVAGVHDLPTAPRRPEDVLRMDRTIADRDRLARLEPTVERPARDPEGFCALDAEPARPRLLLEDEAHARHRVHRLERAHDVLAAIDLAAR